MKLQKESLWILLAIVIVPFYFVRRETIEVKALTSHRHRTAQGQTPKSAFGLRVSAPMG